MLSFSTRMSKVLHLKSHTSKNLWHTFIDPDFKIFIKQKQEGQSSEEYTSMFCSSEHYWWANIGMDGWNMKKNPGGLCMT